MENQDKKKPREKSIRALMELEWEIINELQDKLKDQDLTTHEYTATARALALHVNNLNKLYDKSQGVTDYEEQSLGDFIVHFKQPLTRERREDLRIWKKRLSLRRY